MAVYLVFNQATNLVHVCDWSTVIVATIEQQKRTKVKCRICSPFTGTVEPRYNEVLGTMKITLLYQGKKTKKYKELGPAKLPCYKRVLLYPTSL